MLLLLFTIAVSTAVAVVAAICPGNVAAGVVVCVVVVSAAVIAVGVAVAIAGVVDAVAVVVVTSGRCHCCLSGAVKKPFEKCTDFRN